MYIYIYIYIYICMCIYIYICSVSRLISANAFISRHVYLIEIFLEVIT